jgi:hypothetical protein
MPDANNCQAQPDLLLLRCGRRFLLILENGLGKFFLFLVRPYSGCFRLAPCRQVVGPLHVSKRRGGNLARNKASGVGQYSALVSQGPFCIHL